MTANLNPDLNDDIEDDDIEAKGNGASKEDIFADEDEEEEEVDPAVQLINEKLKTNFKSVDDVVGSLQQNREHFANKGREEANGKKLLEGEPVDDATEVFFDSVPGADLVREDLIKAAKSMGTTPVKFWKENPWIQEKAATLKKKQDAQNRGSVPSSMVNGKSVSDEQKISKKFSSNMPRGFSAEAPQL